MHTTRYLTRTTGELRQGDVVACHGMLCLIDQPIQTSRAHRETEAGGPCRFSDSLVLNREEVSHDSVPYSFTSTASYPSRGLPASDAPHRWMIQGNNFARWAVVKIGPVRQDGTF